MDQSLPRFGNEKIYGESLPTNTAPGVTTDDKWSEELWHFSSLFDDQTQKRKAVRSARACAQCRRRKIRCDGEIPCQRCVLGGNGCQYGLIQALSSHKQSISADQPLQGLENNFARTENRFHEQSKSSKPSLDNAKRETAVHKKTIETKDLLEENDILRGHIKDLERQLGLDLGSDWSVIGREESDADARDALKKQLTPKSAEGGLSLTLCRESQSLAPSTPVSTVSGPFASPLSQNTNLANVRDLARSTSPVYSEMCSSAPSVLSSHVEIREQLTGPPDEPSKLIRVLTSVCLSVYRRWIRQVAETSHESSSSASTASSKAPNTKVGNKSSKGKRKADIVDDPHEKGDEGPIKRPRVCLDQTDREQLQLACPFNKQNSLFFGISSSQAEYRVCGTCSFVSIAHLKQHLQRTHYAPEVYCLRCSRANFTSQAALEQHVLAVPACEPQDPPLYRDRISRDVRKELKLDKRNVKGTERVEYWFKIFDTLFPGIREDRQINPYYEGPLYQQQNQFIRFCRTISSELIRAVRQRMPFEESIRSDDECSQALLFDAMLQEASDRFTEQLFGPTSLRVGARSVHSYVTRSIPDNNSAPLAVVASDESVHSALLPHGDSRVSAIQQSHTSAGESSSMDAEPSSWDRSVNTCAPFSLSQRMESAATNVSDHQGRPTCLDSTFDFLDAGVWDELPELNELDLEAHVEQALQSHTDDLREDEGLEWKMLGNFQMSPG